MNNPKNARPDREFVIVVAPMTYYVAEGVFTRKHDKAKRFASKSEAEDVIDIRSTVNWKACEA